jgi:hypothetical protein
MSNKGAFSGIEKVGKVNMFSGSGVSGVSQIDDGHQAE